MSPCLISMLFWADSFGSLLKVMVIGFMGSLRCVTVISLPAPGAIPPGLNLNATGGLISGTPTASGLFTFSVTVRDTASVTATATVQIKVIDPATIPAIRKVKFKGGRKLIVMGDRINPAAVLLIDGNQMPYAADDGQLLVKPIALASGSHQIRIVNPGGVYSAIYILTVE